MTEKILKEISKRFNNGTETIEDIINYCRNYEIKFENGLELRVVEKKYFDKLVKKIKELEEENRRKDMFMQMAKEVTENSIPKQEVRNKIEEIKYLQSRTITNEAYNIAQGEIIVLQELLEEGE